MADKKPKKKKELKLIDFIKIYFSSLTARTANYIYLNVLDEPDTIILTNADYQMLNSYVPHTLCIHIIKFKDTKFYNQFMEFLDIPTKDPYVLHIGKFISVFNKHKSKTETIRCNWDSDSNLILTTSETMNNVETEINKSTTNEIYYKSQSEEDVDIDEDDEDDDDADGIIPMFLSETITGSRMTNYHALLILKEIISSMKKINEENLTSLPHAKLELNNCYHVQSNVYRYPIDLTLFKNKNNENIFDISVPCHILLIDGSDTPSIKEFTKKLIDFNLKLIVWVDSNLTLKNISHYEDNICDIISTRPFAVTIPIKNQLNR